MPGTMITITKSCPERGLQLWSSATHWSQHSRAAKLHHDCLTRILKERDVPNLTHQVPPLPSHAPSTNTFPATLGIPMRSRWPKEQLFLVLCCCPGFVICILLFLWSSMMRFCFLVPLSQRCRRKESTATSAQSPPYRSGVEHDPTQSCVPILVRSFLVKPFRVCSFFLFFFGNQWRQSFSQRKEPAEILVGQHKFQERFWTIECVL